MRSETLSRLRGDGPFDVLVIGGGATGCGIAVDAATRGLRTALVERHDFAEGTSSRSTKLVHGGVRYLEAAVKRLDRDQYKLVRDALHERGAFLHNAPHLSRPLPLITPIYSWWQVPYVFAGLKMYDLLSGKMNIGHSKLISAKVAKQRFPMLKSKGLKACVLYYDGQFVDVRMATTLAMTAERAGAVVANHVTVSALVHDDAGKLAGATVTDSLTGESWEVAAKTVINATGPFADAIRKMDDPVAQPILKVSSGVHILLDGSFVPPDGGILIPQTDDGRVLFILPWEGQAIVGTTDTECSVVEHPEVTEADITYLLDYVRRYFDISVGPDDVRSAWAGIRPLVFDPDAKDTATLARDHIILEDPSGLITISGGKWTTYRLMAEQAVDRAVRAGGFEAAGKSRTHDKKLLGGEAYRADGAAVLSDSFGLDEDVAAHLNHSYGDRAAEVAVLGRDNQLLGRLAAGHPYIEAEALFAVRNEAAVRAIDVIARRMTLALVDKVAALVAVPRVIEIIAPELGWDGARRAREAALANERLTGAL
ncbi:FAD-dependent oxidoreductase [Tropicimonas isoalkanivorans]|uniref:Glycerol-3-phosphate dehydrogenase n=1 Tax=Tropicimonas isoalkanivorans TaxID=441112 RepID=A0A1I1RGL3_9RHOB|nr:FAD-dependent oxidoreductase [Tropicimonas isoalkanivorans]SFD33419.1 glycerol-3-phosphate dehydrogenase [Tropicimonas isoalkanivorans]